jgi:hypothetical protein
MMKLFKKFISFYQKQDSVVFWSTSVSILMALILSTIYLIYFDQLPNQIPFFYSLPWGDTQLADKKQFFILPALIVLTALVNLTITWHLHSSQLTMKRIIVSSTTIIALLALIAGLRIIFTTI